MIPQPGQHIKCILRTGAIAEGIVEEWFQNEAILKSLDGESLLVITHPEEDIMLIKIILQPPQIEVLSHEIPATELELEFQQTLEQPSNNDLRVKKLVELRVLMAEQDKKIITEKMRNHLPGEIRKVTYGYPGPNKK